MGHYAQLRPLPESRPSTARVLGCTADKYAQVRVDRSTYSIPSSLGRQSVTARLYHDRVEIAHAETTVASHARSTTPGAYVLALEHVLELLEQRPRAATEATVIRQLGLPACFEDLRMALRAERRRSDREWLQVIGLLVDHSLESLRVAVEAALDRGAPGLGTIRQLLRCEAQPRVAIEPLDVARPELAEIEIAPANLERYETPHQGLIA